MKVLFSGETLLNLTIPPADREGEAALNQVIFGFVDATNTFPPAQPGTIVAGQTLKYSLTADD